MIKTKSALSDNQMVVRAIKDSFVKLSPKVQAENPVMLLVYISAILTSLLWVASLSGVQDVSSGYTLAIAIILWLTCIFANFAEAIAEGRGKAQADALRAAKKDVEAYKLHDVNNKENCIVQNEPLSLSETMLSFYRAELNIGMRFHSVVLQTILNGNNIILDYTEPNKGKIYGFLKDIDEINFYKDRYWVLQNMKTINFECIENIKKLKTKERKRWKREITDC